jgi:hypothetical protein
MLQSQQGSRPTRPPSPAVVIWLHSPVQPNRRWTREPPDLNPSTTGRRIPSLVPDRNVVERFPRRQHRACRILACALTSLRARVGPPIVRFCARVPRPKLSSRSLAPLGSLLRWSRTGKGVQFGEQVPGLGYIAPLEYLQGLPQQRLGLHSVAAGHGAAAQSGQCVSPIPEAANGPG